MYGLTTGNGAISRLESSDSLLYAYITQAPLLCKSLGDLGAFFVLAPGAQRLG